MTFNEFSIIADEYVKNNNFEFKAGVIPFKNELGEHMKSIVIKNEYDKESTNSEKLKELIKQIDNLLNKYINDRTNKFY